MKVIKTTEIDKSRVIECPKGGFTSNRILLESDNMGFGMTKTVIPVNGKQFWHYKNHLESCYCVSGRGELTNELTGDVYTIEPDMTYVLDGNEPHHVRRHDR